MTPRKVTKVLIYSQDGFGLGHLRRNLNLCLQIKRRSPEASCLIIADSPVAPFFKLPSKCDFVKLPTIVKVDTGVWRPDHLPISYQKLLHIRSSIIRNVLASFQPQVFIVDHMPHGALGELAGPLEILKARSPQTRVILGLRDILGAPEVIRRQWQEEGAFATAAAFYDDVLIYGCADVFDAIHEYGFPAALARKSHYCGYVCRESLDAFAQKEAAPRSRPRGDHFVLVMGGGGADASFFMDQFINAVRAQNHGAGLRALMLTGPFMHPDQSLLLHKKAEGLPIKVRRMGADSMRYLHQAHLVVSMAGYNTFSEILRCRKNAIIIPRPGPSAEQTMRTRIMAERKLCSSIHPHHLTGDKLAELMAQRLQNGNGINEALLPDLNGASNAARMILSQH